MSKYEFHHLGCGCGCNDYLRNPKESEIERLKAENNSLRLDAVENRRLITELCDALEQQSCWSTKMELIQRAREATR
jgi:hypothetical protein